MNSIIVYRSTDYISIAINGQTVCEGHTITPEELLRALGIKHEVVWSEEDI